MKKTSFWIEQRSMQKREITISRFLAWNLILCDTFQTSTTAHVNYGVTTSSLSSPFPHDGNVIFGLAMANLSPGIRKTPRQCLLNRSMLYLTFLIGKQYIKKQKDYHFLSVILL